MPVGFVHGYAATYTNKRINKGIASQKYARSALLKVLAGVTAGGAEHMEIGRPNEGLYLTGAEIDQAEKESVRGHFEFTQPVQQFKTSNTQVTGMMGTMPTIPNPTTSTQDVALMADAAWRWCVNIDTPIQIWNSTLNMAMAKASEDGGIATGTMLSRATQIGVEEHYDNINCRLIYGSPTNQDAQTWNDLSGVISAVGSTTNRYAMVNRAVLPSDSPWIPQYVSTSFPNDAARIIDYANLNLGVNVFGGGITLLLGGAANYERWKWQIINRDKSGHMVTDGKADGLPGLSATGQTGEIIRTGNAFIALEPFLDKCWANAAGTTTPLYTAQPGYALCLNLKFWKFMTHPDHSMKVEPFVDLHNKTTQAVDLTQSFIRTWAICQCMRPDVNALFSTLV